MNNIREQIGWLRRFREDSFNAKVIHDAADTMEMMQQRIAQLEATLTRIREISIESGAHITVAMCDVTGAKQ